METFLKSRKYTGWNKLTLSPLELTKLVYGIPNKKHMTSEEFKARNEVASNFIKYFNIKMKV